MDYVSAILGQQAQGSQSLSSYPYERSPAIRARRSEPESSALQNVEHATKRVRVDISVDANPLAITEINLDQACSLRRRSGRTRRLFYRRSLWCAAVGHGAAHWTGTKPGAAGSPSSFALASRRQAKIRLGAIPCLRATSDTFAPAADVSARILVLSSGDQWRLLLPVRQNLNPHRPADLKPRSRSHASSISRIKQGGPHQRDTFVLAMEVEMSRRQAHGLARNSPTDPRHEPGQPAVGRSQQPWRTP